MWRIPLPSSRYLEGLDQTVGSAMDSRKQMQQFMMQNQLKQQAEQREQEQQPLKMDELKAKVEEQQTIARNKQKMIDADIEWKKSGGSRGKGVDVNNLQAFRTELKYLHPDWDDETVVDNSMRYIEGETKDRNGKDLTPLTSNYWPDRLNMRRDTTQAHNQRRFAATLESTFKVADENAKSAFKFSGVAGKFKQGFDAYASQVGDADPDYIKFRKFIDQDVPAMVTEIIRTGGANSTDTQKAIAFGQAITNNIKTSPKIAESNYEELKKLYRTIGQTINKGITETRHDLKNQGNVNESNKDVTNWEIRDGKLVKVQ